MGWSPVLRGRAEVFVEPPVRGAPGLGLLRAELPGEVFAQQRVRIERRASTPDRVPVHREQLRDPSRVKAHVALRLAHPDERLGQVRDGGRFQQRGEAVGGRGPVEQSEQPQHGQRALPLLVLLLILPSGLKPLHIRIHDAEGVAALFVAGFFQLHEVALADVSSVGIVRDRCRAGSR